MTKTWFIPQPFETVDHTADTGVLVRGATREEALARLVLGHAQMLSGGEPVDEENEIVVELEGSDDLSLIGVDALREMNRLFCTERHIATRVDILELDVKCVRLKVGVGRYDPERHAEGVDIKAVTFHAARLEKDGDDWIAQVIFDI
ncbi:MAG: archease [Myxococcota bacterium]